MLRGRGTIQCLIFYSWTENSNIFINNCMILPKWLIYLIQRCILKLLWIRLLLSLIPIYVPSTNCYIDAIIALLSPHLWWRLALRHSQSWTLTGPFKASFSWLLHWELSNLFRCRRFLYSVFILVLSSLIPCILVVHLFFFLLFFFTFSIHLILIFFLHITVFIIVFPMLQVLLLPSREAILLLHLH